MTLRTFDATLNKTLSLWIVGLILLVAGFLLPVDLLRGMALGSGIVITLTAAVRRRRAADERQASGGNPPYANHSS